MLDAEIKIVEQAPLAEHPSKGEVGEDDPYPDGEEEEGLKALSDSEKDEDGANGDHGPVPPGEIEKTR